MNVSSFITFSVRRKLKNVIYYKLLTAICVALQMIGEASILIIIQKLLKKISYFILIASCFPSFRLTMVTHLTKQ